MDSKHKSPITVNNYTHHCKLIKSKEMKKLLQVTINKRTTCLDYVMERTGLSDALERPINMDEIEEYFKLEPFNINEVEAGDIVLWNKKAHIIKAPWSIQAGPCGIVIDEDVLTDAHPGVVELVDDQEMAPAKWLVVSDVTRKVLEHSTPSIRMRHVPLAVRYPDFIMRPNPEFFKAEFNESGTQNWGH